MNLRLGSLPAAPAERNRPHYRALPRRFRRLRLLIIGCGDVGCRIAAASRGRWTVYGIARSAQSLSAIRASGAFALAAPIAGQNRPDRRRWTGLGQRVIHAAPPPAGDPARAESQTGGDRDRLTRDWIHRLSLHRRTLHRRTLHRRSFHRRSRPSRSTDRPDCQWPARTRPAGRAATSTARLIYLSTTGVYGNHDGAWIDETTRLAPITARARRRVDAEMQLRQATARASLASTVLRVPGIYAADRLPLARLAAAVPALRADDDVVTNHIHADDLARASRLAILRARPQRTTNVVDTTDLKLGDYLDRVADWAGLTRPPRIARDDLVAAVGESRASFMRESRRIGQRRLLRELRLRLRWPTTDDFLRATAPPPKAGSTAR